MPTNKANGASADISSSVDVKESEESLERTNAELSKAQNEAETEELKEERLRYLTHITEIDGTQPK